MVLSPIVLLAGSLALPPVQESGFAPPPEVGGRFGEVVDQWDLETQPIDAVWAADGSAWVLEARPPRLVRRSPDGALERELELPLVRPTALCEGPEGSIWVLDAGRLDARRVAASGEILQSADLGPHAVAPADLVDVRGGIAVSDPGTHRVLVFQPLRLEVMEEGRPETVGPAVLGGRGSELGELLEPMGLAFDDRTGELLVADAGNHRIQRFNAALEPVGSFGEFGPFPGLFARPVGLELAGDRLYVVEEQNHRIQVFDWAEPSNAPERLYEWGIHVIRPGEGRGRLHYPRGIAVQGVEGEGGTWSPVRALLTEPFADRLQLFGPATKPASAYMNDPAVTGGKVSAHLGPELDARGSLAVLIEPESQELRLLDLRWPMPIEIGRFGGQGDERGRFRGLIDVAFGPVGENGEPDRLFALDGLTGRLSEIPFDFDPEADPGFSYERMRFGRGLELFALREELRPLALASARDGGQLAVLDGNSEELLLFSSDLEPLGSRSAGRIGVGTGSAALPLALALAADGTRAFRLEGSAGSGEPGARAIVVPLGDEANPEERLLELELEAVGGLTPLGDGFVVADRSAHAVVWLDADFHELERIGGQPGLERDALRRPRGLAVDGTGRLLIMDHGNHRLKVLGPNRRLKGAFGPRLYIKPLR